MKSIKSLGIAFNALLKTLEEPPSFVKFILATTEPHRVPDTILSRCQRLDFRRIPVREMTQRLSEVAQAEGIFVSDEALLLMAREAQGSMRDAESLLEQVLAYCTPTQGPERSEHQIDAAALEEALGVVGRTILYELSAAVIEGDPKRCVDEVAKVTSQGLDLVRLSRDLVEHFRNLLVARLMLDHGGREGHGGSDPSHWEALFELPDQEIEELKLQVSNLPVERWMDYFRLMVDGDEDVARSAYPRFALEATLVRLATVPKAMPVAEALERLEKLEQKLGERGNETPLSQEEPAALVEPGDVETGDSESSSDDGVWQRFITFVMQEKKFLASHLQAAQPLELPPERLKIGVEERHHLSYLQDPGKPDDAQGAGVSFFQPRSVRGDFSFTCGIRWRATAVSPSEPGPVNSGQRYRRGDFAYFGGSVKQVKGDS